MKNIIFVDTLMALTWDEAKRLATIEDRGLDFADAGIVFNGPQYTRNDDRRDYGEQRRITAVGCAGALSLLPGRREVTTNASFR